MVGVPLEIERKFLVEAPDLARLAAECTTVSEIDQTYLVNDDGLAERVRSRRIRTADGAETLQLTHTRKRAVSPGVVEEDEHVVTGREYADLLARADPDRRTVVKTRWVVPYDGITLEVDRIVEPRRLWLLEVELASVDDLTTDIGLPGWVEVVREVTGDLAYTNREIARPA